MKEIFESFLPYFEVMAHVTFSVILFIIAACVIFLFIKGMAFLVNWKPKFKYPKKYIDSFSDELTEKITDSVANTLEEMLPEVDEPGLDPREAICGRWINSNRTVQIEIEQFYNFYKFEIITLLRSDAAKVDKQGVIKLSPNKEDILSIFIMEGCKWNRSFAHDHIENELYFPALGMTFYYVETGYTSEDSETEQPPMEVEKIVESKDSLFPTETFDK